MKAVIQRVSRASVRLVSDEKSKRSIQSGLVVLVGVSKDDTEEDATKLARKISRLRLWSGVPTEIGDKDENDSSQQWVQCLQDLPENKIIIVSQFTLLGTTNKGAKPNFNRAMNWETALRLYELLVSHVMSELGADRVHRGFFQQYMEVEIVNDGPVTILVDTKS